MRHLLLCLTAFLTMTVAHGQVTFQKTYGIGRGQSVQQTSDKGFIILGYAVGNSTGISLIKTDSLGVWQWSAFYTSGSDALYAYSVQQTNDGGYIITGNIIYSSISNEDIILLKTSSNGTLQWKKYFSLTGTEYGFSAQQTNDGGFILTGYAYSDVVLIKTASDGSSQWTRTFGLTNSQQGKCVKQTTDNGFIITGFTGFGAGSFDVYLVKTDSSGTLQWTKTFGGTNNDFGNSLQQTTDGGYIIAGTTLSYGAGGEDVYLIKTASDGTLQWTKTFGGTLNEEGNSVKQTNDGGFIITGSTRSYGTGSDDVYLIKTDSNGSVQWTKTFGGANDEAGNSVIQTNDGGFLVNGYTTSSFATYSTDIYLIKTDSNGNSGCYETSPISIEGSGGMQGTGGAQGTGGTTGNQFVQTNFGSIANTICTTVGINEIAEGNQIFISPNPFPTQTTLQTDNYFKNVSLTVYNLFGQTVKQMNNLTGQTIIFHRDNLPSGLYFIRITQDNKIISADKLVIADN